MQKILAAGYSRPQFDEAQKEWMKYGVTIHGEADISDVVLELVEHNDYQLIILFCEGDFLALLEVIRGLAEAPVLVIRPQYDGAEKVMAINAGADEYIGWPETAGESVASGRALIRRCEGTGFRAGPFLLSLTAGTCWCAWNKGKYLYVGKRQHLPGTSLTSCSCF